MTDGAKVGSLGKTQAELPPQSSVVVSAVPADWQPGLDEEAVWADGALSCDQTHAGDKPGGPPSPRPDAPPSSSSSSSFSSLSFLVKCRPPPSTGGSSPLEGAL